MLQLAFGMSREDLQEFGDLILERFSSEQQKPDEISKLLDLVKKVRCSIIASSSQFSRRRPSTPVDDHVRKVRILGGTDVSQAPSSPSHGFLSTPQDNRGTGTKAYRFVLHTPAFQA